MSEQDIPVLGPVTVTFSPEQAAEVAMVLQHILHNVPADPRPDQAMRAQTLGEAAITLSEGLVRAMHDAGLSDELIARASGHLYRAPQEESAQMELTEVDEPEQSGLDVEDADPQNTTNEVPHFHPLDPPADEPHNPSPPVDFPTPGGPPDAA